MYKYNAKISKNRILSVLEITFDVAPFKNESSPNNNKNDVTTSKKGKSIFLEDVEIYHQYIVISEGGFADGENEP